MAHDHHDGHDHSGHHHHEISEDADASKLGGALALLLAFMAGEVVVGILANSLALLSDAAHMLTDAAALGLALVALRLAKRPAKGAMTYGYRRAEILSAQVNGATLMVLGLAIVVEGIRRLIDPPDVEGLLVLIVALVGVGVNVAATGLVARANRTSLNVEGAFQHLLTDLYAFIATAIAGAVVLVTGFARADGIASLIVAGLMLRAGWPLVRESGRVLLEAAPRGIDPEAIGTALAGHPGVAEVHDLHVWEVSTGMPALSAHVLVEPGADCHGIRRELAGKLRTEFEITHTTLQMEHEREDGQLLSIETDEGLERRSKVT